MEALGGYPTRSSNPKAKKLTVLLSMAVGVGCLFLLQTQLLKPRRPSDFYSFEVKDAKGRTVTLEKYRGKVGPHHQHSLAQRDQKLPQRCPSPLYSLEFTLEDTKSVFMVLFDLLCTHFSLPLPGVFSCKRGEFQRADGGQLPVSAGAASGAGHLSLQRPGLSVRTVRGNGDRDQPGQRGFRQVHLRRHVPLLQQDQNPGLRG